MTLRDLLAGLRRAWYVIVIGLLGTAGLAVATLRLVPATYQASASTVLLPPASSVVTDGNPYLYLGGLNQALDVLTRTLRSYDTEVKITAGHPDTSYTVGPDPTTTGPILIVTVDGQNPDDTMAALRTLLATIPPTLQQMQQQLDVPANSLITVMTIAVDEKATAITKSQTRALLAVIAAGLVVTLLATALVDRRRRIAREPGVSQALPEAARHAARDSTPGP